MLQLTTYNLQHVVRIERFFQATRASFKTFHSTLLRPRASILFSLVSCVLAKKIGFSQHYMPKCGKPFTKIFEKVWNVHRALR